MRIPLVFSCCAIAAAFVAPPAVHAEITDSDRAAIEAQLEQTRDEIRRLSERLAELSLELVDEPMRQLQQLDGPFFKTRSRVAMGVTIQSVSGERGARVLAVTPDGPADRSGIRTGDIIVGVADVNLENDGANASSAITRFMQDVEAGDTISVRLERDGNPMTVELVAEQLDRGGMVSFDFDTEFFDELGENIERHVEHVFGEDGPGSIDMGEHGAFRFLFHSRPWSDLEVVGLTPALGDYFGVSKGLLIVRAPKDSGLDLREGDVIVRLNGEDPGDRREFGRVLSKARYNDIVRFQIVRQRQSMTIDATVPETDVDDEDHAKVLIQRFEIDED